MAATFTWSITNCTRNTISGEILRVDWFCLGSETVGNGDGQVTYNVSSEGSQSLKPATDPASFTLFADVTEDQILGWIWDEAVHKGEIENDMQIQINDFQEPPTADGLPWDETVS